MNKKKLLIAIGARPNYIKAWPLINTLKKTNLFDFDIYHSGQHYDDNMSKDLLNQLNFPKIKYNFKLKKNDASSRFSEMFVNLSKLLNRSYYDGVIVFGDVNTTLISTLVAKNKGLDVFHVESGLRSKDLRMPEEINRIVIDHHSDLLFTTENSANINLINENFSKDKIKFVGNLMIETLLKNRDKFYTPNNNSYLLITIHRAENIYSIKKLTDIVNLIFNLSKKINIIFPLHPATKIELTKNNLINKLKNKNITITNPLGYFKFINLVNNSKGVITDSGGIQEEAVFLKKKIVTLRESTERPITVDSGYNKIISEFNKTSYLVILKHIFKSMPKKNFNFEKWDDNTSSRIVKEIDKFYKKKLM